MPFYDFKCKNGHRETRLLGMYDEPEPCKDCGEPVKKELSAPRAINANTGGRHGLQPNI